MSKAFLMLARGGGSGGDGDGMGAYAELVYGKEDKKKAAIGGPFSDLLR